MPSSVTKGGHAQITPDQVAEYTAAILVSLRKMADDSGLHLLSHMLELAEVEARSVQAASE